MGLSKRPAYLLSVSVIWADLKLFMDMECEVSSLQPPFFFCVTALVASTVYLNILIHFLFLLEFTVFIFYHLTVASSTSQPRFSK